MKRGKSIRSSSISITTCCSKVDKSPLSLSLPSFSLVLFWQELSYPTTTLVLVNTYGTPFGITPAASAAAATVIPSANPQCQCCEVHSVCVCETNDDAPSMRQRLVTALLMAEVPSNILKFLSLFSNLRSHHLSTGHEQYIHHSIRLHYRCFFSSYRPATH